MSHKSQSANMVALARLLSVDLGYIYGPKESGPNGAKKDFLSKGRAFMSALGKDLGFIQQEVNVNKAGIAVSGEVYLTGFWEQGSGLYLRLEQDLMGVHCICFNTINTKQGALSTNGRLTQIRRQLEHGHNNFVSVAFLAKGDYSALLEMLLEMRGDRHGRKVA